MESGRMDDRSKKNLTNECLALVEYKLPEVELKLVNESIAGTRCIFIPFSYKKTPKVT
jgi:hypothetical protein